MKLTMHIKDVGSFDLAVQSSLTLESFDDEKLSSVRNLLNCDSLYIQLLDGSYLFLGKKQLENTYIILSAD